MSIPYLNIAKAVMLRAGQLGDAVDAAAMEALYAGTLASAVDGTDVPLSALKQQILASEKRIAALLAKLKNPVVIGGLTGRTADIADRGVIPAVDNAAKAFLGVFLAVKSSTDGEELTEKPKQEVRRLKRLIDAEILTMPAYHFCIAGRTLYHTCGNAAYIEGVSWDYATQSAAYAAGNSPLPQEVESMWTADVIVNLPQEEWLVENAGIYAGIVTKCEQDLKEGVIPTASLPDTTVSQEPVKN